MLEITRQRYGFLRLEGLVPGDGDIYVSASQVRRCELRPGDEVAGPAREPRRGERHRALVHVDRVNGEEPGSEVRPEFDALAPELPGPRVLLDTAGADLLVRAIDLLAPLALGQRVLIRAAPRSGRTTLLRALARAAIADGNARAIVLLIDERPEEAPGWREALPVAEFAIATSRPRPDRAGADRRGGDRAGQAAGGDRRETWSSSATRSRASPTPRAASTRSSGCSAPAATSPAAAR